MDELKETEKPTVDPEAKAEADKTLNNWPDGPTKAVKSEKPLSAVEEAMLDPGLPGDAASAAEVKKHRERLKARLEK